MEWREKSDLMAYLLDLDNLFLLGGHESLQLSSIYNGAREKRRV